MHRRCFGQRRAGGGCRSIRRRSRYTRQDVRAFRVRLAGEQKMRAIPASTSATHLASSQPKHRRQNRAHLYDERHPAVTACRARVDVVVASYVNLPRCSLCSAPALRGGRISPSSVPVEPTILARGRRRAGRYVHNVTRRLTSVELNERPLRRASSTASRRRPHAALLASEHGRALRDAGFGDDLAACGAVDAYGVLPVYHERQITKVGPERER